METQGSEVAKLIPPNPVIQRSGLKKNGRTQGDRIATATKWPQMIQGGKRDPPVPDFGATSRRSDQSTRESASVQLSCFGVIQLWGKSMEGEHVRACPLGALTRVTERTWPLTCAQTSCLSSLYKSQRSFFAGLLCSWLAATWTVTWAANPTWPESEDAAAAKPQKRRRSGVAVPPAERGILPGSRPDGCYSAAIPLSLRGLARR